MVETNHTYIAFKELKIYCMYFIIGNILVEVEENIMLKYIIMG